MSEQEIEGLRQRWQEDRKPALTLELAAGYRERDDLASALEVLEAGLQAAPDDLAARVAKGRCHLDLDQAEAARDELHRVVRVDPVHLHANQLLAVVHARLGDADRARDRLDFYTFLGGDPQEIDELERSQARPADAPSAPLAAEPAVDDDEPAPTAEPTPAAEPFELPSGEAPGALEMIEPAAPDFAARTASRYATARLDVVPDDEPFALDVDEASYRAALAGEGLFATSGPTAPASDAASAESATPTLTLAALYRRQGHHDEAAGILRQILARQPGNAEAARALVDLEREHGRGISADDLLGGAGDPNPPRAGRTADQLLKRYRQRLRGDR